MKLSELAIVIAAFVIPGTLIILLLMPGVTGPLIAYASSPSGSWVVFGGLAIVVFCVLAYRIFWRITRRR